MLFPSSKIMICWKKKNQYQINKTNLLLKPFTSQHLFDMIQICLSQIPWKCRALVLILYLFNRCGWLGVHRQHIVLHIWDKHILHIYVGHIESHMHNVSCLCYTTLCLGMSLAVTQHNV